MYSRGQIIGSGTFLYLQNAENIFYMYFCSFLLHGKESPLKKIKSQLPLNAKRLFQSWAKLSAAPHIYSNSMHPDQLVPPCLDYLMDCSHLGYTHLDYNHLDYNHLDYNHLDYTHLDYTHLDYTNLDYTHLDYYDVWTIAV